MPSPLASLPIATVARPSIETMADEYERTCCECGMPAQFGEPTCGSVECLESLNAALFVDLDGDAEREGV